jgi:hypothetical protein
MDKRKQPPESDQKEGATTDPQHTAKRQHVEDETWPEDFHRALVMAIFEAGLKNASPAVIMEHMTRKSVDGSGLTSERIKSHVRFCRCYAYHLNEI